MLHLGLPMTRYRGRISAKAIETIYPHFVDIIVPPGGLGTKLDAMYGFHARHGIAAQRSHGRHDANGTIIRRCFADKTLAMKFADEFSLVGR